MLLTHVQPDLFLVAEFPERNEPPNRVSYILGGMQFRNASTMDSFLGWDLKQSKEDICKSE